LLATDRVLASIFVIQVLVVEDDPDVRDSIVDLLQSEVPWIEVSSANDGMEALELLEEGAEPSLALLDVMMPVMNGVEFLDALRDRHLAPAMQIVLISAHVQFARHVNYPGITGLLPKPFKATDLVAIVRDHCPDPRATRRRADSSPP
jgi:CheY-like chemotaxis protein